MKSLVLICVGLAGLMPGAWAQSTSGQAASEMQRATTSSVPRPGETDEQHGKRLIEELLVALGGPAWLNRGTVYEEGQVAAFFRGQPTGAITRFIEYRRLSTPAGPEVDRTEYLTIRGVILPGMKKDVAHVWTANQGYELTYKGQTVLPVAQVGDYLRRRAHTLDETLRVLIHQPGVTIVAEGTGMRDRVPIDKVTVLTANGDSVTLELEQSTHLPVQRGFEWRNPQFQDHDLDEEVYGDWRMINGVATPMNMTRYKNGDMISQTFYTKVEYGKAMAESLFDPNAKFVKK